MSVDQRQRIVEALEAHRATFSSRERKRVRAFLDKKENDMMWALSDFDEAQRQDPLFVGPPRPVHGFSNGKKVGIFLSQKAFLEKLDSL